MTDIDEARKRLEAGLADEDDWCFCVSPGGQAFADVRTVLHALDAAERERDEARAYGRDLVALICRQRDEVSAVLDEVRRSLDRFDDSALRAEITELVSRVPADVLRERDAATLREAADALNEHFQDIPAWTEAYREGVRTQEWMEGGVRMVMGAVGVLRARADEIETKEQG